MGIRVLDRRGVLTGAAALAGCRQAAPSMKPPALPAGANVAPETVTPRLGPTGAGYIEIAAPIVPQIRNYFVRDVNRYLDLGATEIYVLMSSPGGIVTTAQDLITFIETTRAARSVTFTMHNTGVVASAASYVFLAGQRRLSVPRGTFLFHEASLVANGAITSQGLQEANARMQQIERTFLNMLVRRTRLKEAEALSFIRRTVLLSAPEAQRDGVIQDIAPFALPPGATIFRMRAQPTNTATPRPGTPPPPAVPAGNG